VSWPCAVENYHSGLQQLGRNALAGGVQAGMCLRCRRARPAWSEQRCCTVCACAAQELRRALDEERKANDQLIQQADNDRQAIDQLEGRCAGGMRARQLAARRRSVRWALRRPTMRAVCRLRPRPRVCHRRLRRSDEALQLKEDELSDQREQLARLRDDFDELRGQYAALTAGGAGKEQQREMAVGGVRWRQAGVAQQGAAAVTCTAAGLPVAATHTHHASHVVQTCAGDNSAAGVED
jgi:hypothetical protein